MKRCASGALVAFMPLSVPLDHLARPERQAAEEDELGETRAVLEVAARRCAALAGLKPIGMMAGHAGDGLRRTLVVAVQFQREQARQPVSYGCIQAEALCFRPEPFTRFCIYGFIALIEAGAIFALGLTMEARIRRRSYAPDWQSR